MALFTSIDIPEKLKKILGLNNVSSYTGEGTPMFKILAYYIAKAYKNEPNIIRMIDSGMLRIIASDIGTRLYKDSCCSIWKLKVMQSNFGIRANVDIIIVGNKIVHCGIMREKMAVTYSSRKDAPLDDLDIKIINKYKEGEDISVYIEMNDLVNVAGSKNFTILGKDYSNNKLKMLTTSWVFVDLSAGKPFVITPTKRIFDLNKSIEANERSIKYYIANSYTEEQFIDIMRKDDSITESAEDIAMLANITSESLAASLNRDGNIIPECETLIIGNTIAEKYAAVLDYAGHELSSDWMVKAKQKSIRLANSDTYEDGTKINTYVTSQTIKHRRRDITRGGSGSTVYEIIKPNNKGTLYFSCGIDRKYIDKTVKTFSIEPSRLTSDSINIDIVKADKGAREDIRVNALFGRGYADPMEFLKMLLNPVERTKFAANLGLDTCSSKLRYMLDDKGTAGGNLRNDVFKLFLCHEISKLSFDAYADYREEVSYDTGYRLADEESKLNQIAAGIGDSDIRQWLVTTGLIQELNVAQQLRLSRQTKWFRSSGQYTMGMRYYIMKSIFKVEGVENKQAIGISKDVYVTLDIHVMKEKNTVLVVLNPHMAAVSKDDLDELSKCSLDISSVISKYTIQIPLFAKLGSILSGTLIGIVNTAIEPNYTTAETVNILRGMCTYDCKELIRYDIKQYASYLVTARIDRKAASLMLDNLGQASFAPYVLGNKEHSGKETIDKMLMISDTPIIFVENKNGVNNILNCVLWALSNTADDYFHSVGDNRPIHAKVVATLNIISIMLCQGIQQKHLYEQLINELKLKNCEQYLLEMVEYAAIPHYSRGIEMLTREVGSDVGSILATNNMYSELDDEDYYSEDDEEELLDELDDIDVSLEEEDEEASDSNLEEEDEETDGDSANIDGFDDDDDLMGSSKKVKRNISSKSDSDFDDDDDLMGDGFNADMEDDEEAEADTFDLNNDTLGSFIDENGVKITWAMVMNETAKVNAEMSIMVDNSELLTNVWLQNYLQLSQTPGAVEDALKRLWANVRK